MTLAIITRWNFNIWYDMIWYDMIWYDMIWYDMIWYDMIWYDMISYDIIWFFCKNAALKPNYNVQCNRKRRKKHSMTKKQSNKYNNRQQRSNAQLASRQVLEKIESRKTNYGSLLLITPHSMGLDYLHIS